MNVIWYTEKSFVVNGETKEYKEELKNLGGKWNSNLSCGGGWIFSMKSLGDVEKFVKSKNDNEDTFEIVDDEDRMKSSVKTKLNMVWLNNLFEKFIEFIDENTKSIPREQLNDRCISYMMELKQSFAYELFMKFICQTKPSLEEYIKLRQHRDSFIELALCKLCIK